MRTLFTTHRARGLRLAIAAVLLLGLLGGYAPASANGYPTIAAVTVRDADTGDPIADVEVDAWLIEDTADGPVYHFAGRAYTDADGKAAVCDENGKGPGPYKIEVWMNGYAHQAKEITWNGTDAVDLSFDLVAFKPIANATVKDAETGDPIQDAEVCAYFLDPVDGYVWTGSEYTGIDGTCTVTDEEQFGAGTYKIAAWADGYVEEWTEVVWDGSNPVDVSFELEAAGTVEVPICGSDRIGTAIEASKHGFPTGADTVVIATAYNWPDAFGGAALAGAAGGPVLLVPKDVLPETVADEVHRLGAIKVYLLGGTGAISTAVQNALEAVVDPKNTGNVVRIAGRDRYETARMVAAKCAEENDGYDGVAFVATGEKFPDALGASPLAAAKGWPIFLVDPRVGADTTLVSAMKAIGVNQVIVLGGTSVVSDAVKGDLQSKVPCRTDRWWGLDRYGTAAQVAEKSVNAGLMWDGVGIATGENFPDALAAGPVLGRTGSVLLLTKKAALPDPTRAALAGNRTEIEWVRFFGGTGAVAQAVRDEVLAATK
ncbi:MAG: cell wall-binding repeat-containing protein [Anaerosomatales bacterium]|nr:cell wall-binding repeat-containing protein [Anaerosomatales bacterium]